MCDTKRLIFTLLFILYALPVLAAADFSDEPVEEITHPDWFKQSFLVIKEDIAEAKASGKDGIIVFFGQPHCAYCNALIKNDFGNKAIADYTRKHFDVIALNIYGDRTVTNLDGKELAEHDYAKKMKAELTPTLDFYDTENRLVYRLRGYYPPEKFSFALRYVAEEHYRSQRFRDYLSTVEKTAVAVSDNEKVESLFMSPPYNLDRSQSFADKPLMVLFDKGDCKPCDTLRKDTLRQADIQKLGSQFDAVRLDMWSQTPVTTPSGQKKTAVEWAENMGLFFAPTIVFFDESGNEIYRVDSLVKLRRLKGILTYILSGDYTDEPNYELWKTSQKSSSQDK